MDVILIACKQVIFPYGACLEIDKMLGWGQNSCNEDV